MIDLTEYILRPKAERQKHLDLSSECCERGGNSTNHKGVLAQYLDTTIPSGRILLCHACGNGKCSNPLHLYWGTDRENIVEDGKKFGTWSSPWERLLKKQSLEDIGEARRERMIGNTIGSGNKGAAKTEEHKANLSKSLSGRKRKSNNSGRKRDIPYEDIIKSVKEHGFKISANQLGLSVAALKGRYYNALKST